MKRRDALNSIGLVTSHVLFPSVLAGFISGCKEQTSLEDGSGFEFSFFGKHEIPIVKEVIDLIMPETNTRSASQVGVHFFLDDVFGKCLSEPTQQIIKSGFVSFIPTFEKSEDKLKLITEIDVMAFNGEKKHSWFIPMKQYTLIGFFTSEEGTTKASNHIPIPGDYNPDIPADDNTLNYGFTSQRYYL